MYKYDAQEIAPEETLFWFWAQRRFLCPRRSCHWKGTSGSQLRHARRWWDNSSASFVRANLEPHCTALLLLLLARCAHNMYVPNYCQHPLPAPSSLQHFRRAKG